jgi:hypothetical protein
MADEVKLEIYDEDEHGQIDREELKERERAERNRLRESGQ